MQFLACSKQEYTVDHNDYFGHESNFMDVVLVL